MPVAGGGLVARNRDLRAMIESAARVGPGHWVGLAARERAERGLVRLVESLRDAPSLQPDSPLARIALGRDEHGWLLSPRVAAVEVLNVLRPTVAIARFVAFAAHAMAVHAQPDGWLASPQARLRFVHEVRRFYPFFPAVAAVASREVEFAGRPIPAGTRVLVDLYGTDRHPGECPHAESFDAGRFTTSPVPTRPIPTAPAAGMLMVVSA